MEFVFSPEDEAFRKEIRHFFQRELPADWYGGYDESGDIRGFVQGVRKKMAATGWLTMSWPKEYGGQDAPASRQLIFAEECAYYRFAARDSGVGFLGPAIMHHGNEEQKQRFLGPISRAEIDFHQGFSEPNHGSDLAGLETKATRDGDEYVINGTKIWGGGLDHADYSFLLARTDPDAPKHKGISLLIIPADTPGLKYEELANLGGGLQNLVYYDSCRVPARECLIGEENQGWYIATTVLNHERAVVEYSATARRFLEELVALWKEQGRHKQTDGPSLVMRHKLAQIAIEIEVARMLAYRIGWIQSKGTIASYEASEFKIFGSELTQRFAQVAVTMLGLYAQIDRRDPHEQYARLGGRVEHNYRQQIMWSLIGGSNEIQRNVIAARGLGLPRS